MADNFEEVNNSEYGARSEERRVGKSVVDV